MRVFCDRRQRLLAYWSSLSYYNPNRTRFINREVVITPKQRHLGRRRDEPEARRPIIGILLAKDYLRDLKLQFRSWATSAAYQCRPTAGRSTVGARTFYGSLGNGTTEDSNFPRLAKGPELFSSVEAGTMLTCAHSVSKAVYCL